MVNMVIWEQVNTLATRRFLYETTLHTPASRQLKRRNQAKIIKKSSILFWLLNMAIICEHVHRLVLSMFFIKFVLRIYQLSEK